MAKKNALVDHVSHLSTQPGVKLRTTADGGPEIVTVSFNEGQTAKLDMSEARGVAWAEILDSFRQADLPVYVEVDPTNRVVTQLLCPLTVRVERLTPTAAGDLEVELVISAARHYLRRTNPDFQELKASLEQARQDGTPVVVTETTEEHEIIDVRVSPLPPAPAAPTEAVPPVVGTAKSGPITLQHAQQVFDAMNSCTCAPTTTPPPCIPFLYPDDGCWARAHQMCRLMIADGEQPGKIWNYGGLTVWSHNKPSCVVGWSYHVAPTLEVQTTSGAHKYVIDPAMFSGPVPYEVWVYAQSDPSSTVVFSGADIYYRNETATYISYDADYSKTEQVLVQARGWLKTRAAGPNGPPPYISCYRPDIFLRDNLQDIGLEPTVGGGISRSPDINHYRQQLADPQATLGSAAAKGRDDLFENIEYGQANYLYARLQNCGMAAGSAEVDLYWSKVSTLPTPSSWNLIGSLSTTSVAPGELKVLGPLEWNTIPSEGHYCFIGVVGNPDDPKPDLTQVTDISDFHELIRNSNNVVWKNFDVENAFASAFMQFDFLIRGWPRIAYPCDLELLLSDLPRGTKVELRIVKRLTTGASLDHLTRIEETSYHAKYQATSASRCAIRNMPLHTSDQTQAMVSVTLPDNAPDGRYELAVLQRINGQEMGRITKQLVVGDHPYVANRRTGEVHKANCEWVQRMSGRNKIAYQELALALQHGRNGCRYCLPEHDTDG